MATYPDLATNFAFFFCYDNSCRLGASEHTGDAHIQGRIFAVLSLCFLFIILNGDAQSQAVREGPVWTIEFIKVRPENFGLALGYLDDQWMCIREEAKRQGEILSYHRIQETVLRTPGVKAGDPNTILLLTEYKNLAAFSGREKLFAAIRENLPSGTPGVLRQQREDLYETVGTQMFMEVPDDGRTGLKLLAKQ